MDVYTQLQDNIYEASRDFLDKLDYQCNSLIWQYGNGPEPTEDYCAMYIIDIRQVGKASESTLTSEIVEGVEDNQQIFYTTTHDLTVQYTFVGALAPIIASRWQHQFKNNRVVRDNFFANKLAIVDVSSVKPISIKRETVWVDNATIDVRYRYSCQSSQQVDWVQYITVNGVQSGPY